MKPKKEDKLQQQGDLVKVPRKTLSKNMRNLEDIMADYIADPNIKLSAEEERLLDRQLHEKTGKRLPKFKDKKPKPENEVPTIIANGGAFAKQDTKPDGSKAKKVPARATQSVS